MYVYTHTHIYIDIDIDIDILVAHFRIVELLRKAGALF